MTHYIDFESIRSRQESISTTEQLASKEPALGLDSVEMTIKSIWNAILKNGYEGIYFTDCTTTEKAQVDHFLVCITKKEISLEYRVGDYINKKYRYEFASGTLLINAVLSNDKRENFFKIIAKIAGEVETGRVRSYSI